MADLTSILKSEIARIARKELKSEIQALRKVATAHRADIAALKRDIKALTSNTRQLARATKSAQPEAVEQGDAQATTPAVRFTAAKLVKQRERLGLTQQQMARLMNVSSLSIYKWEKGQATPRQKMLAKFAALPNLSKKQAAELLA